MKKYLIPATFCALVGVFVVVVVLLVFFPVFRGRIGLSLVIGSWVALFLLGVVLIFLTLRQKVEGKLKKFLILTGASSAGFFISAILHNVFYGVGMVVEHITVLKYLAEALHVAFFLIAIPICPLAFLVGVVGSAVLFFRERRK